MVELIVLNLLDNTMEVAKPLALLCENNFCLMDRDTVVKVVMRPSKSLQMESAPNAHR